MAKKMIINSAVCDARKVTEETLAAYESIVINSATLLTNDQSRSLLGRYPVTMNCAQSLDVEGNVQVRTINGSAQIRSTDAVPAGRQLWIVNGSLEIGPDTEKILEHFVGMTINGSVTYPESLSGRMGLAAVNGTSICYPDGAVVLKKTAVIDRLFALRAKNALYWAKKRMIFTDPQLDPGVLTAKGSRFQSGQAILAESKVEGLIDLIDERTEIVVVPDGTAVVADDLTLDEIAVKKYGTKLYILGSLKVKEEGRAALEAVEYLNIRGNASVDESVRELLLLKAAEIGGNVRTISGRVISDHIKAKISRWLLEQEPKGIRVTDCVSVRIDKDVPNDLILKRLTISDCVSVACTEEQEDAVTAVSSDVAQIGHSVSLQGHDVTGENMGDMVKKMLGGAFDTKIVNSTFYVM